MRRRRARLALCAAVAASLAVIGTVAAPVSASKTPAGPPITVHFVNLDATASTSGARQGVTAAVKHINRTGGIAGRPVAVTECLTDQTPEKGKACIDAAIAAKPAAVFAVQPGTAADNLAALSAAGIPYVAQTCNTNATLSGQFSSFCFGSDFVGLYSASANYLRSVGTIKTAALPYVNVPAASTGVKAYATPILVRAGITPVEVPIPETAADITSTITAPLQGNVDSAIALLTGPGCVAMMKVRKTLASTKPYLFPAMCTDPDVIADAGAGAGGALFVRQTVALDRRDADVRTYRAAMRRFAPGAETQDVYAQSGFAGIMNLAAAMRLVPATSTIDAATTTAAFRAAKSVPMFLTPGGTYTCDGSVYAGLRALCSLQAHVVESDGKKKWTDKGLF